ncbi:MAG: LuxR C-terminal-related transcriptional regulator [Rhodopila sp.]
MGTARRTNGVDLARLVPRPDHRAGTEDTGAPTLLIVSDIRLLREGVAEVLTRDKAFTVVGAAADLDEAFAIARARQPQVILLDATFPGGLDAARRLTELSGQTFIVALALAETDDDVIAWAEAGIAGYVPRTAGLMDVVSFLQDIVHGEQFCSTRVTAGLLRWIATASRAGQGARARAVEEPELTAREEQVARLLCNGLSNKEISRRLDIGVATTKSHVHNLLAKLRLERRGQVMRWSSEHTSALRGEP